MATNTIVTIADTGVSGFAGDEASAVRAELREPQGVAVTADGGYVIADTGNHRVRRVALDGQISTIAGSARGLGGDEGPATDAQLDAPQGLAIAADGSILIADSGNHRIRRISPDGLITTVVGTTAGLSGDGGPATDAQLNGPRGVAVTAAGGVLIADTLNALVRHVSGDGTITTVAGVADQPAAEPPDFPGLVEPVGVAATADGGFLIAQRSGHRI